MFPIILKSLHPSTWLPTAQEIRPSFLYDPAREIHVYREILWKLNLGTPAYLHSDVDHDERRVWLLLEHVPGPLLWQLGQDRHWQSAARWLARLHQLTQTPHDRGLANQPNALVSYDESHFLLWAERAERFISSSNGSLAPDTCKNLGVVFNRYERIARSLSALPRSLIHGEFYPSNIIMRHTRGHHHVCPIDWELTGWGSGILDLAALTFGGWSREQKQRLIQAYVEGLAHESSIALERQEVEHAVDLAHLHLCIRQLGWAAGWVPPAQHARDWPNETLRLADRLGLLH